MQAHTKCIKQILKGISFCITKSINSSQFRQIIFWRYWKVLYLLCFFTIIILFIYLFLLASTETCIKLIGKRPQLQLTFLCCCHNFIWYIMHLTFAQPSGRIIVIDFRSPVLCKGELHAHLC